MVGNIGDRPIRGECELCMLQSSGLEINSGHTFRVNYKGISNSWKPAWGPKNNSSETAFISYFVRLGRLEKCSRHSLSCKKEFNMVFYEICLGQ